MATDPEDAILDDIIDAAVAEMDGWSPERQAENARWVARQNSREARPLRERALEAARRMTGEEAVAVMRRQMLLSQKDVLTEDDKKALRQTHTDLEDHPRGCFPYADLIGHCLYSNIMWLEEYIQTETWGWSWWADYFGQSLEEYASSLTEAEINYIRSHPYPEGWAPEGR